MSLNIEENNPDKERFIELLLSTKREGIDTLIEWLSEKSDFFTAPSSTVFHNNFPGGLLKHSLNVYDMAIRIYNNIHEINPEIDINAESIIIAALLHDICKVNQYEVAKKWRKDADDKWEQYDTYIINDKFPLGHGEKSLYLLSVLGINIKKDEALAIRWHMLSWESANLESVPTKYSFSAAINNYPLVSIIGSADCLSSLNLEKIKK